MKLTREWDYMDVINSKAGKLRGELLQSALTTHLGRKPNKNDLKQVELLQVPNEPDVTGKVRIYALNIQGAAIGILSEWFEGTVYKATFEGIEAGK